MNFFKTSFLVILVHLYSTDAIAQESNLHPLNCTGTVEISYHKTTSLIFSASIKSVDRGSKDILVTKAKGVENVLLVKAGKEDFPESNITIVTGDGQLYCFTVHYSSDLKSSNFQVKKGVSVHLDEGSFDEEEVAYAAQMVLQKPKNVKHLKEKEHKVNLAVEGIHTTDELILFKVRVQNSANINYDINFLQFTIKDKLHLKKTASQENILNPVFILGDLKQPVTKNEDLFLVYAFSKFTIADDKIIEINLQEKGGGRHVSLAIINKHLLKAQKIKSFN